MRRILACSALAIACAPGERSPTAPVHGTLALEGERARAANAAPFAVVFAAPKGKATSAAEISVVFNRPVRSLDVAGASPPPPITIAPPIDGKWLWVGSRGLRFVPAAERLTPASHYVVAIPATVRALDGATLAAPYRLEFETPRPAVVDTSPYAGDAALALDTHFDFEMNQRVDPARFERAVNLYAENGARRTGVAYAASRPDPRLPKKLRVTPRAPLPKDSAIVIEMTNSLVGEEGPLPSGEPKTFRYRTYGPLRVEQVSCDTESPHGRCAPSSSVGLALSNPVDSRALRAALTIEPAVKLHRGDGDEEGPTTYVDLSGLAAGGTYKITLAAELADRYGQALGKPEVRVIKMDDYFPAIDLGVTGDTLPAGAASPIQIGAVNYASYELLTASVRPDDVPRLLRKPEAAERLDALAKLPYVSVRTVSARGCKNRVVKEPVVPKTVLGGDRGVLALGVRHPHDPHDYHSSEPFHLLKVTDLAVSAKLSRHGSVVWVTRLATGEPVANAGVDVVQPNRAALHFTTDVMGLAKIPETAFAPNLTPAPEDEPSYVFVRSGNDWTFENIDDHLPEWRLPVWVDLSGKQHTYGMLFTERGVYRPGDVVKLKGILRSETPRGN
ncbi:MAG TPA: Ig-like domain-containing protein, partial [Polyangiaceae bacterium]|nr:Ig-like domain-containing protein [Polyangiaceae bacterium]